MVHLMKMLHEFLSVVFSLEESPVASCAGASTSGADCDSVVGGKSCLYTETPPNRSNSLGWKSIWASLSVSKVRNFRSGIFVLVSPDW